MLRLIGYSDRFSVAPGETIRFMVSADELPEYRAAIVRLIHGDANPDGPGFKTAQVKTNIEGCYPGRKQLVQAGSYVEVPDDLAFQDLPSFTVAAYIWPTMPGTDRQTVIAKGDPAAGPGFALELDDKGGLAFLLRDTDNKAVAVATGKPLISRQWYLVAATFDAVTGTARLFQLPVKRFPATDDVAEVVMPAALGRVRAAAPA